MTASRSWTTAITDFAERRRRWLVSVGIGLVAYALLGFFAVPWLLTTLATNGVQDNLNATLTLEDVHFNPFLFRLQVDGAELDDLAGDPVARLDTLVVDFQSSSLFRWALTFAEIRLDAPVLYLDRNDEGALNTSSLLPPSDVAAPKPQDPESSGGMPRLLVRSLAVNDSEVHWFDAIPPTDVDTVFGPISVALTEFSTLPARQGQQEVIIATESQGTLRWSGTLSLNPALESSGTAAIEGSHFPLLSAYLRHETGIDIVDGIADIRFRYAIATHNDGLSVAVDDFRLLISDILVSTFIVEENTTDRELLRIPAVELTGGTLRWPKQSVSAEALVVRDAAVDILRKAGIDPDTAGDGAAPRDDGDPNPAPADALPWTVTLDRFAIENLSANLQDQTIDPAAETGLRNLNLDVRGISSVPGAVLETSLSLEPLGGGRITLGGPVTLLPAPNVALDVELDAVALAGAQPYVQALANVDLSSGQLNLSGTLRHAADTPLVAEADINVLDFLLSETDEDTRLGSWQGLYLDEVVLDLGNDRLDVSEIRLDQPYADVLIAADGSVNLGRVRKTSGETDPPADAPTETTDPDGSLDVTIGRIVIDNASADFADESLPLPFSAKIDALNGTVSTIATSSDEPSSVALEGKVDEFGLLRVSGFTTPLAVAKNTDLKLHFENVEIPKFSAYTIPFAGREIASGRLDLDLGYELKDSALVGNNRIVLRDFELGDEVPHPGAMSLPLGLAVALLKDPSGKIDLELPVRGNVDDPEFGYGKVIGKALANLIVKIVASPFALLGNLVGVEANELEYINFLPGRSDMTPPEIERAGKLAEALGLRPELILEVHGVVDREADSLALRTALVDARVDELVELADSNDDNYTERRFAAISELFEAAFGDDPDAIDALRTAHTSTVVDPDSGRESEQFDALAFAEALRERLIDIEPLEETALVALGQARRDSATRAVLAAAKELEDQVVAGDLREERNDKEADRVRMKVVLSAGGRAAD